MRARHLGFGVLFGFILSRVGATDYDAIAGMFRLTDLHLVGVIGGAVAVAAIGFAVIKKKHLRARTGEAMAITPKPMTRGVIAGGLAFGVGWALSGTCPGTALAQIGEGRLAGLFTFAGILLGSYLHELRARGTARPAPSGPRKPAEA